MKMEVTSSTGSNPSVSPDTMSIVWKVWGTTSRSNPELLLAEIFRAGSAEVHLLGRMPERDDSGSPGLPNPLSAASVGSSMGKDLERPDWTPL
jgi:hypothetical protein